MRSFVTVIVLLLVVGLSAQDVFAQITITYQKESGSKKISLVYSSGGYISYYPYAYSPAYAPGIVYTRGNTTFTAGTNFSGSLYGYGLVSPLSYQPYLYSPTYISPLTYGYAVPVPSIRYPADEIQRHIDPVSPASSRTPSARESASSLPKEMPTPVSDQLKADRDYEKAMQAFSRADYPAAEKLLKDALIQSDKPTVRLKASYGLALFARGDYYYAGRALRDVLDGGAGAELLSHNWSGMFRDSAERSRCLEKSGKSGSSGGLWEALIMYSSGQKQDAVKKLEEIKNLQEMVKIISDPVVRTLLEQMKK